MNRATSSKPDRESPPAPVGGSAREAGSHTPTTNPALARLRLRREQDEAAQTPATETTDSAPTRRWDDASLRIKLTLIILLAAVGGCAVGLVESHLNHRIWPLLLGLSVVSLIMLALAHFWTCGPIFRLLDALDQAQDSIARPNLLGELPVERADEVGRLARVLHKFSLTAARDYNEARQLRRTLDDRIERATRLATRNLKELAMRDPLTDLANRRFLDEHLPALFESCRVSNTDLACIAIDVDNFKPINDTLGHGAGDELLRSLGKIIAGSIRHEDYAIRLGGDEFIILMPGCPVARVRQIGEQIIALFRQHVRVMVRHEQKPDLSLGVATTHRDNAATTGELLQKADAYLYEAKRAGKGRIVGA